MRHPNKTPWAINPHNGRFIPGITHNVISERNLYVCKGCAKGSCMDCDALGQSRVLVSGHAVVSKRVCVHDCFGKKTPPPRYGAIYSQHPYAKPGSAQKKWGAKPVKVRTISKEDLDYFKYERGERRVEK